MGAPFGNKNAHKGFPFRDAIRKAIAQGQPHTLRKVAEKLVAMALDGDLEAIKELANRLDGRPGQRVELEVNDTSAARMAEAEERLRQYSAGSFSAEIQQQLPPAGEPDYLQ